VASGEKKMKLDFLAILCDGNMQLMQYESRDRILPPCSFDGKLVKVCPATGLSHLQPKMLQVVVRM
jgi:hypothetical protein